MSRFEQRVWNEKGVLSFMQLAPTRRRRSGTAKGLMRCTILLDAMMVAPLHRCRTAIDFGVWDTVCLQLGTVSTLACDMRIYPAEISQPTLQMKACTLFYTVYSSATQYTIVITRCSCLQAHDAGKASSHAIP
jgi:hypothetical protein